jgi:nucleoside-diphosphate-sugar epimerase
MNNLNRDNIADYPVLVTGGTGFLGRALVKRLLDQGRMVRILARTQSENFTHERIQFFRGSLTDTDVVNNACKQCHTVFHVAAKVGVFGKYDAFYETNVLGTQTIISACKKNAVRRLIYTSTPSVVYNGQNIVNADESLPLTTACPSPYPLTKAIAEKFVLDSNSLTLGTVALRPHLIWGIGDTQLIPRVIARADSGRLKIIGSGKNKVDMVHVENVVDAHLLAEISSRALGNAYFITNDEPVFLWEWINNLLMRLGKNQINQKIPLPLGLVLGSLAETVWNLFSLKGEPPLTRFIAAELAKDHWFNISAAKRDLNYSPKVSMKEGTESLVTSLLADGLLRTKL